MPDMLSEINAKVATSFETPDREKNGYKIFFREFLPSYENAAIVGVALAWKDRSSPYYYAIAGSTECGEYKAGDKFRLEPLPFFPPDTTLAEFMAAKNEAIDRVEKCIPL